MRKPSTSSDIEGDTVPHHFGLGSKKSQGCEYMVGSVNYEVLHLDVVEHEEVESDAEPHQDLKDLQRLSS